jgi:hypothetical protein
MARRKGRGDEPGAADETLDRDAAGGPPPADEPEPAPRAADAPDEGEAGQAVPPAPPGDDAPAPVAVVEAPRVMVDKAGKPLPPAPSPDRAV